MLEQLKHVAAPPLALKRRFETQADEQWQQRDKPHNDECCVGGQPRAAVARTSVDVCGHTGDTKQKTTPSTIQKRAQ